MGECSVLFKVLGVLKQSRKALHKNQYQLTIHPYSDHAETASVTHHTGTILLLWFGGLYLTILSGSRQLLL